MLRSEAESARGRIEFAVEVLVSCVALALVALAWTGDRSWLELHFARSYCVTDLKDLHRWTAARALTAALGVCLGLFFRRRIARTIVRKFSSKMVLATVRIAFAVVAALVLCDVLLRARGRGPDGPTFPPIHPDAKLGWVHNPKSTTILKADDRDIAYAFNRRGFRSRAEDDLPDPARPSILFAGESFTEGLGVSWDETYAAIVGERLSVQVVQSAVWGYGYDQSYLSMKGELPTLQQPLAVVTLVLPQEMERTVETTRPHLALDPSGLLVWTAPSDPPPRWWATSPLRKLAVALFPYHDAAPLDLARAIFRATSQDATARGAYPLFVLTNWREPPCLPASDGAPSIAQRLFGDLAWIEVRLDPTAVDRTTHHPNAASHRLVADAVERALRAAHVVPH